MQIHTVINMVGVVSEYLVILTTASLRLKESDEIKVLSFSFHKGIGDLIVFDRVRNAIGSARFPTAKESCRALIGISCGIVIGLRGDHGTARRVGESEGHVISGLGNIVIDLLTNRKYGDRGRIGLPTVWPIRAVLQGAVGIGVLELVSADPEAGSATVKHTARAGIIRRLPYAGGCGNVKDWTNDGVSGGGRGNHHGFHMNCGLFVDFDIRHPEHIAAFDFQGNGAVFVDLGVTVTMTFLVEMESKTADHIIGIVCH